MSLGYNAYWKIIIEVFEYENTEHLSCLSNTMVRMYKNEQQLISMINRN